MTRVFAALAAGTILLASLTFAPAARADEGPETAIRSVIGGQIAAFLKDDKNAAYSFAAPSIRRIFPNPDLFMGMVRSGYQPVYRPKSVTYGRMREAEGLYIQEVFVVGPDGEAYTAIYSLQQQPDGEWKITGCRIARSVGESA